MGVLMDLSPLSSLYSCRNELCVIYKCVTVCNNWENCVWLIRNATNTVVLGNQISHMYLILSELLMGEVLVNSPKTKLIIPVYHNGKINVLLTSWTKLDWPWLMEFKPNIYLMVQLRRIPTWLWYLQIIHL